MCLQQSGLVGKPAKTTLTSLKCSCILMLSGVALQQALPSVHTHPFLRLARMKRLRSLSFLRTCST